MATPPDRSILCCLENEQLSAITFVQDYVQLHFDGPCLNAYVWPQTIDQNGRSAFLGPGYRDALCGLIGCIVTRTLEEPEQYLAIHFADGRYLEISLKEGDRQGPEAAMFSDGIGGWNVW